MKTYTTTSIRRCLLAAAILCLTAISSYAAVAVDPIEDGGITVIVGATLGWSFTATSNINVTALGYYDFGGNGLAFDHPVGIWANGGALLGSVTVTTSDPITDGFRYEATPSIALLAGQTYVIGGFQPSSTTVADAVLAQGAGYSSFTTAPEISYLGNREVAGASLARPDATVGVTGGIFGPNFQFEDAGTAVPEPSTALWGMLVLGVCVREAFGRGRRSTDAQPTVG